MKRPRAERDRLEVEAACRELSEALAKVVGFAPHFEADWEFGFARGAGVSLGTMRAITKAINESAASPRTSKRKRKSDEA